MNRRAFAMVASAGLSAIPPTGDAQTATKVHRIAIVVPSGPVTGLSERGHPAFRVLFQELRRLGYVEGVNVRVERRSAEGRSAQYGELARGS